MEQIGFLATQPELLRTCLRVFETCNGFIVQRYLKMFSGLYFHALSAVKSGELETTALEHHYIAMCEVARKIINMSTTVDNDKTIELILRFHEDALMAHNDLKSPTFARISFAAQQLNNELIESLSVFAKDSNVNGTHLCLAVRILLKAVSDQPDSFERALPLVEQLLNSPPSNLDHPNRENLLKILIEGLEELTSKVTYSQQSQVTHLLQNVKDCWVFLLGTSAADRISLNNAENQNKSFKLPRSSSFQLQAAAEVSATVVRTVGEEIEINVEGNGSPLLNIGTPLNVFQTIVTNTKNDYLFENEEEKSESCYDYSKPFHTSTLAGASSGAFSTYDEAPEKTSQSPGCSDDWQSHYEQGEPPANSLYSSSSKYNDDIPWSYTTDSSHKQFTSNEHMDWASTELKPQLTAAEKYTSGWGQENQFPPIYQKDQRLENSGPPKEYNAVKFQRSSRKTFHANLVNHRPQTRPAPLCLEPTNNQPRPYHKRPLVAHRPQTRPAPRCTEPTNDQPHQYPQWPLVTLI